MTVIDTSGIVDLLLGVGAASQVVELMTAEGQLAAPDLLVFEVIAVLRRYTLRGLLADDRAGAAVDDLGDLPLELFPSLPIRERAWELRRNLTAADALFISLAEQLAEPFATKDSGLAVEVNKHTSVDVLHLGRRD